MATTMGFNLSHGSLQWNLGNLDYTGSGTHEQKVVETIATSEETFTIAADITGGNGPGLAIFANQDATNYVEIGVTSATYFLRIDPGDAGALPLASGLTTLYLRANTANVITLIWIFER